MELFSWFTFWFTYFFEKNELIKEHRISRLNIGVFFITNLIGIFPLSSAICAKLIGQGNGNVFLGAIIALLVFVFQIKKWVLYIRRVDKFVKSDHGWNYATARWDSWWEDRKNREDFLEKLYVFEKGNYDYWKSSGGEERDRARKEEERRKWDEEFRERSRSQSYSEFNNNQKQHQHHSGYSNINYESKSESNVVLALRRFGLSESTNDIKVIRKKYIELIKIHHPDVGGDQEKAKEVILDFEVLQKEFKKSS